MERLVAIIKSTPPAEGYDEVLVAGEPEWRMEAERRANGIPLGARDLEVADQCGVAVVGGRAGVDGQVRIWGAAGGQIPA